MKKQVVDVFNELAGIYKQMGDANNLYNTQYERPAMMELVPQELAGLHILDAGCSAGWYSEQLAQRGAQITAVDISPEMVKHTHKLLGDKASVICLDLEETLPFQDETFDVVVSSLTLHYLKEWRETFKELHRVLKPGGSFLLSIHHPLTDLKLLEDVDYFSTELIVDSWNKGGKTYKVPFFRKSLSEVFESLLAHFTIERVVEPKPTEIFKKLAPEQYAKLMKSPNFLILKVSKSK
ncbi:methylase [Planococcus halocryophilus Or1]|uniref:Ubiquinone biosynthesis methyltransferase UbiE n=1 Tax=Planococcus halocryophilus TaxID=1215089 RepID=A0A1C7DNU4_9BACL|nr:class I SAM-dependent methyltransferase [Planococcus halocryophilus]ANU13166.1 ubiquinone biosynthesis methyltransferase UbiE [Planococcus halocryophilus]EMF46829.1 methylase [Planococcus halocryophilus Or1]